MSQRVKDHERSRCRQRTLFAQGLACPPLEKVGDLLANRLSSAEAAVLRQHLRECPACRQRFSAETVSDLRYPFLSPAREDGELGWLAHFRILGVLGEGGMAVVFDAEDTVLHRRVALKVLRPDLTDPTLRSASCTRPTCWAACRTRTS